MSHQFTVSDEAYQAVRTVAEKRGLTPEDYFAIWLEETFQQAQSLITSARDPQSEPRYFEPDDWFRHLGVAEEHIQQAKDQAAGDTGTIDADV